MTISVVIPAHNAEPFLPEALASVERQIDRPVEVIVVNDSSHDGTAATAQRFGVPARLIEVEVRNAAAARNRGAAVATAEWLAFLDSDNVWWPMHLQQAANALACSDDIAYMAYPGERNGNGLAPLKTRPLERPASSLTHWDYLKFKEHGFGFPTTGMVVRRDRFLEVGGFDETQVRRHDFEMFMRIIHERTWSFEPGPTWWTRPPRPGDISSNPLACEHFALRALLLNRRRYRSLRLERLIFRTARKAIVTAKAQGNPDAVGQVYGLLKEFDAGYIAVLAKLQIGKAAPSAVGNQAA